MTVVWKEKILLENQVLYRGVNEFVEADRREGEANWPDFEYSMENWESIFW